MKVAVLSFALLACLACNPSKPKLSGKQYSFTGKIVSVDTKSHTATVDAAAIPNFMDAMTMEYPISSDSDLAALKVGENINAKVNVSEDGSYSLSDIHERPASETGK